VEDVRGIEGSLGDIQPVEIRRVERPSEEARWEQLVGEHHYPGVQSKRLGRRLRYLIFCR